MWPFLNKVSIVLGIASIIVTLLTSVIPRTGIPLFITPCVVVALFTIVHVVHMALCKKLYLPRTSQLLAKLDEKPENQIESRKDLWLLNSICEGFNNNFILLRASVVLGVITLIIALILSLFALWPYGGILGVLSIVSLSRAKSLAESLNELPEGFKRLELSLRSKNVAHPYRHYYGGEPFTAYTYDIKELGKDFGSPLEVETWWEAHDELEFLRAKQAE